jgi:tetratricopeptide (TPR) repeat protein
MDDVLRRLRADDERLRLVDALRVQALIHLEAGHPREAFAALEEGLALADAMPYPYAQARLLHTYGDLLAREGEPVQARERLEAALAIFQRLGARKDAEQVGRLLASLD